MYILVVSCTKWEDARSKKHYSEYAPPCTVQRTQPSAARREPAGRSPRTWLRRRLPRDLCSTNRIVGRHRPRTARRDRTSAPSGLRWAAYFWPRSEGIAGKRCVSEEIIDDRHSVHQMWTERQPRASIRPQNAPAVGEALWMSSHKVDRNGE